MGGSIRRSIYQDLTQPLQGNTFPNYTVTKSEDAKTTDSTSSRTHFPKYTMPRTKSEDSCPKDKLLDGGTRGKDKKRTGHREVRQYHTDFHLLACPLNDLVTQFLGPLWNLSVLTQLQPIVVCGDYHPL